MKTLKFLILFLIVFVAGFFLGQSLQLAQNTTAGQNSGAVQENQTVLRLQFGESELTEFQNIKFQNGQTVLDILKQLTQDNNITLELKDYAGLGTMVNKIGELTNGQDNKYWQYYINDQYSQTGADKYQLKNNDIIEWRFAPSTFNQPEN